MGLPTAHRDRVRTRSKQPLPAPRKTANLDPPETFVRAPSAGSYMPIIGGSIVPVSDTARAFHEVAGLGMVGEVADEVLPLGLAQQLFRAADVLGQFCDGLHSFAG